MNSGTQAVSPEVERVMEWKRKAEDDVEQMVAKRPRMNLYFRLESESSMPSEEDTESVDSIQGKETDFVQDSSDTDLQSDSSQELEVELEYDVASLSGEEQFLDIYSTSGTEDLHERAIAAVLCDSSLDAWASDGETSDSSSVDEANFMLMHLRKATWTCVQCKSQKNNPVFRYCDKCFQRCWQCKTEKSYQCFPLCDNCFKVRKTLFPPRPRGNRKRKLDKKQQNVQPKVKLDTLQSCLKNLSQESAVSHSSQDSAIGSSQELSGLDFNKIIVPVHLRAPSIRDDGSSSDSDYGEPPAGKKRKFESSSDIKLGSSTTDITNSVNSQQFDNGLSSSPSQASGVRVKTPEKELCIMCNTKEKNGIFIHSRLAHMCCCYECAMRTWKTNKRCPVCNCKVKNVMQLFTA